MIKRLKRSFAVFTILILVVLSLFTGSMIGGFSSTVHATSYDDLLDICLLTNTYIEDGQVDRNGFWECVGRAFS